MSFTQSERSGHTSPGKLECLMCYNLCKKAINRPANVSRKVYKSCCKHLNSTITKESVERLTMDSDLLNRKQMQFCQHCFDTALELTQLSEQLDSFQRDLSDLVFKFSLKILHRRREVNKLSTNTSIEIDVSSLPYDLFSSSSSELMNDENIGTDENESEPGNMFIPHVEVTEEEDEQIFNSETIQIKNEPGDLHNNYTEYEETGNEESYLENENCFNVLQFENQYSNTSDLQNDPLVGNEETRETTIVEDSGFNDGYAPMEAEYVNSVQPTHFRKMPSLTSKVSSHNDSSSLHGMTLTPVNISQGVECYAINDNSNPTTSSLSRKAIYPASMLLSKLPHHSLLRSQLQDPSSSYSVSSVSIEEIKSTTTTPRRRRISTPVSHQQSVSQYTCSECQSIFADYRALMVHMRSNKHYKCDFCQKSSTTLSDFRRHRRIHTGEKPYECPVCSRAFNDKSTMLRHSRGHSGERPFVCSLCNKSFRRKENLKTHTQLHFK